MVKDMKSKLLVTLIQGAIDLRLLIGYKLVTLDSWTKLNLQLSEHLSITKKIDELRSEVLHWKDQYTEVNERISLLWIEKDRLIKDLHETSAKLTDTTTEVEIANSEMLILRDSLEEATELSKQLKEALDRWMS